MTYFKPTWTTTMSNEKHSGVAVLRLPTVKSRVALSRSSIYAAIAKNAFPAPIKLGERAVGWLESDVEAWLASRIQVSRGRVAV
jgi:prophage regulatory protein